MDAEWHVRDEAADGKPAQFDLWLRRELRNQFSAVLHEPLPDELMALIAA